MIKVIVGLGNPGPQYKLTRHNAGFVFLDYLLMSGGGSWSSSSQFQGDVADLALNSGKLLLLKPMTFMNKSGNSVGKLLRFYKIKPEEMLVVHDELELAEGAVKLKRDGGHAGHNGLRDIIAHIDTRDFYRLRVGIGRPTQGSNIADYVLSRPSQAGIDILGDACERMVRNLDLLLTGDVAAVNALTA
jgi:peptidyl-tRNA hydrolase, PTH1 family